MSYEVVESRLMYDGNVFSVYLDKIVMPDGNIANWETIERGDAVGIVPVDELGNIYFVRQYRHAAKEFVLEIPAGMIDRDENPLTAAHRELEEETGKKSASLTYLNTSYMAIGICTEVVHFFVAEKLKSGNKNLDPEEFIETETYTMEETIGMIFDGRIKDTKTIAGILMYKEYKKKVM